MSSRSPSRRLCLLLLALAALCVPWTARAQAAPTKPPAVFDFENDRTLDMVLESGWRFQPGDDVDGTKGWAAPAFDDSKWAVIKGSPGWQEQGYPNYAGSAWYRAKLIVPTDTPPLALYIPILIGSYQVFIDGRLAATQGGLPPHPWQSNEHARTIPLSNPRNHTKQTMSLAIRVWNDAAVSPESGGLAHSIRGVIRVGEVDFITRWSIRSDWSKAYDSVSMIFLAILELLGGIIALALFLSRRSEREYLWFSVALLLSSIVRDWILHYRFQLMGELSAAILFIFLGYAVLSAKIFFYARFLRAKRGWLYWMALASAVMVAIFDLSTADIVLRPGLQQILHLLFQLPFTVWIIALVVRRAWQGMPDARLLLVPVLTLEVMYKGTDFVGTSLNAGWIQSAPHWFYEPVSWPYSMSMYDVPDTLFLLAMLVILIRRFTRTRLHEESYEREREAARTVQQVLIPEEIPSVPGFEIESVYRPFGEVGGDFFQILPNESGPYAGSVLIAIGDVSGKGLPAAMTVSLLVGTLRTLAHYTQSPGEILAAMNERMTGRNNGGFTTCLVLRADADGALVIANAGHLSPYRDGEELAVEAGLPLGLSAEAVYPEARFELAAGARLTLMTDGVLEARSKSGELFGFERTEAVSADSADSIAATAEAFGQDDDITVLRLRRLTASDAVPAPVLQGA